MKLDRPRNGIEKSGPAAATVKLCVALVEWGIARSAIVHPLFVKLVVLTGTRRLCTLLPEYTELLRRQNSTPLAVRFVNWELGRHGGT